MTKLPLYQVVFGDIDMTDAKSVSDAIKRFTFTGPSHQSRVLQSLKGDMGVSITKMAKINGDSATDVRKIPVW